MARATSLLLGLTLLIGFTHRGLAQGVQIMGQLSNFDVRYPNSLPNDLEIYIYGAGLKTNDVINTFANAHWGRANSITASINTDPTSPAFGLDCVVVRYVGPPLPALVGQMRHFGVRLRGGVAVAHQEIWWTINGQRIQRPCDPQITWICTTTGWLVCVQNPTPQPIYVYGCRFFPVPGGTLLPRLSQLNTAIQPTQFGSPTWIPLQPPGPNRVFCIQPWCRIYFRVQVTRWRPIVFQMAARNVDESVFPLNQTGNPVPDPNDWNGESGTMVILTDRPVAEMREDLNNDGGVGIADFNQLRASFGTTSEDQGATD